MRLPACLATGREQVGHVVADTAVSTLFAHFPGGKEPLVGRVADEVSLRLLVRYVLEIPDVTGTEPDPSAALYTAFAHLQCGWPDP